MTIDPQQPQAPHDLLGAYLLDAVDERERLIFEEHLLGCPDCERELAELAPAVEEIAAGLTVPPPAPVRDAVLEHVRADGAARAAESPAPTPADELAARREDRSTRRLLLLAGAAAAVAVVMALMFGPFRGDPGVTAASIAAADDAQRYEVRVGDATATVILSRTLDRAAVETTDMTPPPDGRDYQVWLSHADGTMTDAGLMPHEEDATLVLSDAVGDAVGVGITMEPAGGSPEPTGEPVVLIPFEA